MFLHINCQIMAFLTPYNPLIKVEPVHCLCLLLLCIKWSQAAFTLTVLHTNDLHSRFDQVSKTGGECKTTPKCYGGVARIKHVADQIKAHHPNSVFLNAGDFFQVRLKCALERSSCTISRFRPYLFEKR